MFPLLNEKKVKNQQSKKPVRQNLKAKSEKANAGIIGPYSAIVMPVFIYKSYVDPLYLRLSQLRTTRVIIKEILLFNVKQSEIMNPVTPIKLKVNPDTSLDTI